MNQTDGNERSDTSARARCAALFEQRGKQVERLARRLLGQDADDGVQEVYAATVQSLDGFAERSQLTTWFHRLAIRVLSRFRSRRDQASAHEQADGELDAVIPAHVCQSYAASPFDRLVASERRQRLHDALDQLSPTLREALVLRLEGLSYQELADALEIPVGTVKSRMAAAMTQLANLLQEPN